MAASSDDKDAVLRNDYYALLNVDKKASVDEINNAFRHLSKIYHPDKHVDPVKKKKAEEVFNKLRKAHDVLRDKTKRTIYDMYGEKGLETEDMEVIARTKTPSEIITEYERIQKEKEERRLLQRTNPRGTISVAINATEIFDGGYDDKVPDYRSGKSIEISSMSIGQSVECPLTHKDTVIVGGNLDTRNGIGQGMFSIIFRRLMSTKGWVEGEIHMGSATAIGMTGFRQVVQRCNVRCGLRTELTQYGGFRPMATFMVAYQFDRNLQGRLTYNLARPSSLVTNIVFSSEQNHFSSSLQLGTRSSYISFAYTRSILESNTKIRGAVRFGTLGGMVECSVEKKITDFSHVGGTLMVGVPQGVHLKIKLLRGQQTFFFPIYLSDSLSPSAIVYGVLLPFVTYYVVRKLIVEPVVQQQKIMEAEKQKEEYADKMSQRKSEAEKAIELMKETYERHVEQEDKKSGLVIIRALYGKLPSVDVMDVSEQMYIDVTIPVQSLVKDSKLILPETSSKSGLPGFYDPFMGEEKKLYIKYRFKGHQHDVLISDTEPIRLPQQKHIIQEKSERTAGMLPESSSS